MEDLTALDSKRNGLVLAARKRGRGSPSQDGC